SVRSASLAQAGAFAFPSSPPSCAESSSSSAAGPCANSAAANRHQEEGAGGRVQEQWPGVAARRTAGGGQCARLPRRCGGQGDPLRNLRRGADQWVLVYRVAEGAAGVPVSRLATG